MLDHVKRDALGDSTAALETRLKHDVHRVATSLLAGAAARPAVPLTALAQLRDFVVLNLRHHHEWEEHALWPCILTAAPDALQRLDRLCNEHRQLEDALAHLASLALTESDVPEDAARAQLKGVAREVRNIVLIHLDNEESLLIPALRNHISPEAWADISQQVIATTPPTAGHLMIGFLDEVGTPAEAEVVLARLPEPVRSMLPAMRRQASEDLSVLRDGS
ncbi:hemerythrin domain-containing protein [Streptomyces sp. NPDC001914]|uniref:hemerythrin domain-containing protein n=1 Tax=Streptomyces sp. NPDC001914 TaxID=3364623 RepID=UPI00368F326D